MKITQEFLADKKACQEGVEWFTKQKETDLVKILEELIGQEEFDWANWLITRAMIRPQYLAYAIFAAEQVIEIYENSCPGDDRPRKAIEAAKAVLVNGNEVNRKIAAAAASAAAYAAHAHAAAHAAYAAAYVAACADDGAYAAAHAAYATAHAEDAAADAKEMKIRIINYGISLLKKDK